MRLIQQDESYKKWLIELKQKVRTVQIKAAVAVNSEMLRFYWELGSAIVEKQAHQIGEKVLLNNSALI